MSPVVKDEAVIAAPRWDIGSAISLLPEHPQTTPQHCPQTWDTAGVTNRSSPRVQDK